MPNIIGGGDSGDSGMTQSLGYWSSEMCDNSLASFPDGSDFSWGVLSFRLDGCDENNYVNVSILKEEDMSILLSRKYTENGAKQIDLSQYYSILSTQDVRIRMEITSYL